MIWKDTECPVCHHIFTENDDVVFCPECGTPHHRECWNRTNHCANENLHGTGFAWKNPEEKEEKPKKQSVAPAAKRVKCENCGAWNEPGSNVCENCGERLGKKRDGFAPEGEWIPRGGFFGAELNPDIVPDNVLIDGIPAEEEAAYVGPGSTRYLLHFINRDRTGAKIGWNWAAALFSPLWLFYRKMYLWGFVWLLAYLLVSCLTTEPGLFGILKTMVQMSAAQVDMQTIQSYMMNAIQQLPPLALWQQALSSIFQAGSMIAMGLFGDRLYQDKIKRSILKLRPQASSMPEYMNLLQKKGGVSILMPLVSVVLYIAINYLAMIIASFFQ